MKIVAAVVAMLLGTTAATAASWALMILGVGATGLALRRRMTHPA